MKKLALIGILFLIAFVGFGQSNEIKRTYYYSFTNVSSDTQIEDVVKSVSALKWVKQVKPKYKGGTSGQIIVIVEEPLRTGEQMELFSVKSLKNVLIEHRLTPTDLTQKEEKLN